MKQEITIIGAGMAGCLMAIYLARDGYEVEIFESQDDITKRSKISNRSVNQSLSIKGIDALVEAGVWEKIKRIALPQKGRIIHQISGTSIYQSYGQNHDFIEWTVNRNELNTLLLQEVKKYPRIHVFFQKKLIDIDLEKKEIYLQDKKTEVTVKKKVALIIGADGINSRVREILQREGQTENVIEELPWGYKNIYISQKQNEQLPFLNSAFHLWSRKNAAIFGMVSKRFFTCTLTLPLRGENSFDKFSSKEILRKFFKKKFPDLSVFLESSINEVIENRPTPYKTVYTAKWYYKDFIVFIGDASHAIIIFYGQGVNAAFEDCSILSKFMKQYYPDYQIAFKRFQTYRKKDTDTIGKLCIQRLYDFKDRYESPFFLAKNQIEMKLEYMLPNIWLNLYTLLVHTKLPYAEGLRRYKKQRLLARLFGLDLLEFIFGIYLFTKRYFLQKKRYT